MNALGAIFRLTFIAFPGGAFLAAAAWRNQSLWLAVLSAGCIALVCAWVANIMPSYEDQRGTIQILERSNQSLEIVANWKDLFHSERLADFDHPTTFTSPFFRRHVGDIIGSFGRTTVLTRSFNSPPFDYELRAYASTVGYSFVFLLEAPNKAASAYSRFRFFHEMGHVSIQVKPVLFAAWRTAFLYTASGIIVVICSFHNVAVWLSAAYLLFLAWFALHTRPYVFEQRADWFALTCLETAQEVADVIDKCNLAWSRNGRPVNAHYALRLHSMRTFQKRMGERPADVPLIPWNVGMAPLGRLVVWLSVVAEGAFCKFQPVYSLSLSIVLAAFIFLVTIGVYVLWQSIQAQHRIEKVVRSLLVPRVTASETVTGHS